MLNGYKFQLLVPAQTQMGAALSESKVDDRLYEDDLASMQRLRGRVYLSDGAIQPAQLDGDGRFAMSGDEKSWHLLLKTNGHKIIGCARYRVHPNTIALASLAIFQSSIAGHRKWGEKLRLAVEADLWRAREHNLSYVEIGGWALCKKWRGTRAALEILTASYALAPTWGGCMASCTATVRHRSASILRRVGGSSFEVGGEKLPPYDDPRYGCTMELLRFDSRSPAKRFVPLIAQLQRTIACAPIIQRSAGPSPWSRLSSEAAAAKNLPLHIVAAYN